MAIELLPSPYQAGAVPVKPNKKTDVWSFGMVAYVRGSIVSLISLYRPPLKIGVAKLERTVQEQIERRPSPYGNRERRTS